MKEILSLLIALHQTTSAKVAVTITLAVFLTYIMVDHYVLDLTPMAGTYYQKSMDEIVRSNGELSKKIEALDDQCFMSSFDGWITSPYE